MLYAALQVAALPVEDSASAWGLLLRVNVSTALGLALALVVAAAAKLRPGYRVKGRLLVFVQGAARGFFGALEPPPFAPPLGVGGRNRRLENLAPVEVDVGILRLERVDLLDKRLKFLDFALGSITAELGKPVEHSLLILSRITVER